MTEGISIRFLCNSKSSGDCPLRPPRESPKGSLKGISKAETAQVVKPRARRAEVLMIERLGAQLI